VYGDGPGGKGKNRASIVITAYVSYERERKREKKGRGLPQTAEKAITWRRKKKARAVRSGCDHDRLSKKEREIGFGAEAGIRLSLFTAKSIRPCSSADQTEGSIRYGVVAVRYKKGGPVYCIPIQSFRSRPARAQRNR